MATSSRGQVVLTTLLLLICLSQYVLLCSHCFQDNVDPPPYHIHHQGSRDPQAIYPLRTFRRSIFYNGPFLSLGFAQRTTPPTRLRSVARFDISSPSTSKNISVDDFGAKGDGTSDDTQAFEKAWKAACSSKGATSLTVPDKNYLIKPIKFSGPCQNALAFQIYGTITASGERSDYSDSTSHWVVFNSVQNLVVDGGGTVDGNGKIWWYNSCKVNKALPCKKAPTAITFSKCKNLTVSNLKVQDAQQMHISFDSCTNVQVSNLVVTAPRDSPNTDGIHVTNTRNIRISNCTIGTGDDCISIVSGSKTVQATDITCGPGHGISIGSLGSDNSKAYVSGVTVNKVKLSGTTNGVRIKTWQGGSGSASNIKFQNIEMQNVTNPIIIDQNYCDQSTPCKDQKSAVQVKNVVYQNIKGTSASEVAIEFDCSKSYPCEGITLQDVDIEQVGGQAAKASCSNVKYTNTGAVSPQCSL